MNLSNFLEKVFVKPSLDDNPQYTIRKESFLLSDEYHQHYLKHGWCKIQNVVKQNEIDSFLSVYNDITTLEGFGLDNHFLNTGCLPNTDIRTKTSDVINKNAEAIFPRILNMDIVEKHTGGSYVIKPAHEDSSLPTHQDSSFIDEEKDYSLFLWIPFCNVSEDNGPIYVLPGSHLWGNTQRSLRVPWNLQKHIPLLNKYMTPVYMNVGDILIFDPALVHSSGPNRSSETRHAITITAVRKNPELIFFYKNENIAPELIEKYYVNEQFFREYDFASKPDETKWRKELVKYNSFDFSEKEMIKIIEQNLPELS